MDNATVIDLAREALIITLMVSGPILVIALGIGLLIGIVQAATSINEATLSFIPKLFGVGLSLVIFGSWQINVLTDYVRGVFERIPGLFS
jgi:flagellar biosynthetic protein FliQ